MNDYPLIKFVIFFIAGIVLQSILQLIHLTLFISVLAVSLLAVIFSFQQLDKLHYVRSAALISAVVLFGSTYYSAFTQQKYDYPFPKPKYSQARIAGAIEKIDLMREGRINFTLSGKSLDLKEGTFTGQFNLLCSIYDENKKIENLFHQLKVGNKIKLTGVLRRPRDERNPNEFDYEKYLSTKEVVGIVSVYNADSVVILSNEVSILKNTIFEVRKIIDEKITSFHNKTAGALLRGLILADRSLIDYQINDYFINAGVVHVLSVSGLHVGYIVLIFLVVFNRFNIFTRYLLTFAGLLFYMIITGADSPVFRSTVMAFVLLAAPATGRRYYSLNSLSLSAFIILLINPKEIFNPGFQLSFSAILSLILIYPPMRKFVESHYIRPNFLKYFLIFSVTSISAQLGTLPFVLTYFHRLSISAIFANLIVIPASGAIVGLGILTVTIGIVWHSLGIVFGSAGELLTYLMYKCVQILGNKNFSFISFSQFSVYDAFIFYFILGAVFYILKTFASVHSKIVAVSFALMLMIVLMRLDNYDLMPKNELSVMAVDVGQGNAVLVKFPDGKTALIDAGNSTQYFDNGERVIIPLLDKLGIDQIDYGIVSHIDSDHSGGFISLIKNQRVKQILKPKVDATSFLDRDFEKLLGNYHIPLKYFSKEKFAIGNARLYVLNDTLNNYTAFTSSNDRSGIIKIVYGNNSFLLTGDASIKIEKNYSNMYKSFLASDVLLAGHHGSRTSTGDEFLRRVNPSLAIISAGVMNKFNHPHRETIQKLNAMHVKIFRTDMEGAVLLHSNGTKISHVDWRVREHKIEL